MNGKAKTIIFLLLITLITLTGCSKTTDFNIIEEDTTGFHQINVAEKVNGGILYYDGDRVIYEKDSNQTELADGVQSLWREGADVYFVSQDALYLYELTSKETKKIVDKPHTLLGKYKDSIISYSGRNIYAIDGTGKTKVFKDGYYLNRAVLYHNKVYGIPAKNVYEYNLDTFEVKKITKNPDSAAMQLVNGELWIETTNEAKKKNGNTYKLVNDQLEKVYTSKNGEYVSVELNTTGGQVLKVSKLFQESAEGNRLLYLQGGKVKQVDCDYFYDVIGTYNHQLCYYKNSYYYATDQENLKTFYFFDGKKNTKAFDLDVGYFEAIEGYQCYDGLLIEVVYEMGTDLYKYGGNMVEKVNLPEPVYRILVIDVIDHKAYIKYSDGEESFNALGAVVDLESDLVKVN